MAGTDLRLTPGSIFASFRALRLEVADLFTLEWAPFQPDRSHVSLSILTPCCAAPLAPNLGPGPMLTECSACSFPYPYPTSFHLALSAGRWRLDGQSFTTLLSDQFEPLTAAVIQSEVEDLLHELMARASGEYAWQPEGNLRGSRVLPIEKQDELCKGLLQRFGGEVGDFVYS